MTILLSEDSARVGSYKSILRSFHFNMNKPAKPKEILGRRPNKSISLREQYAELLKLREEIRRLSSRINPQRRHSA
jgi:hypothetical protein